MKISYIAWNSLYPFIISEVLLLEMTCLIALIKWLPFFFLIFNRTERNWEIEEKEKNSYSTALASGVPRGLNPAACILVHCNTLSATPWLGSSVTHFIISLHADYIPYTKDSLKHKNCFKDPDLLVNFRWLA